MLFRSEGAFDQLGQLSSKCGRTLKHIGKPIRHNLVRVGGIEPPRLSPADFKSAVFTYFTTLALNYLIYVYCTLFRSDVKIFLLCLASRQGLEPRPTVLETDMLPLHQRDIVWRTVGDLNPWPHA